MTARILAAVFAAAVLAAVPARAQVPAGPEFQVNTTTSGTQRFVDTWCAASGDCVVAWSSIAAPGPERAFVRRFDAAGQPLGPEVPVSGSGPQVFPSIVGNPPSGFVVVWSGAGAGDYVGIFGRRFDAAGVPRGSEFRVNEFTTGLQRIPDAAEDSAGNLIVVWQSLDQDGSGYGVFGRRMDALGAPRGSEFRVNDATAGDQIAQGVASDGAGNFTAVWIAPDGDSFGVFGRRFDAGGAPVSPDFRVNTATAGVQFWAAADGDTSGNVVVTWADSNSGLRAQRFDPAGNRVGPEIAVAPTVSLSSSPSVDFDRDGRFVIAYTSADADGNGVFGRIYDVTTGAPAGATFAVNAYTTSSQVSPSVSTGPQGSFVVAWESDLQDGDSTGVFGRRFGGLTPAALAADAGVNRVLEVGETAIIAPAWRNLGVAIMVGGTASAFTGPPGPTYTIVDGSASYGVVPPQAVQSCTTTSDCFAVEITAAARPERHWDAVLHEDLVPAALVQSKAWTLHVGGTFADVASTDPYYRFVETIVHHALTDGCSATHYCPAVEVSREQLPVLVLRAREGVAYVPPDCGVPMFADVAPSSPFCRWIEELARRGVVAGCGGGLYCPSLPVSRAAAAVILLATLEAPGYLPPPCTGNVFTDVPATSPYCRWIEELARRSVVSGCGSGRYCPEAAAMREQAAVLLAATFALQLYGP